MEINKMEINVTNITTSLVTTFIVGWLWKMVDWLWIKPKQLEKILRKQGFSGNPYRFFVGDTKDITSMVKETTSMPMECFSNDYCSRIFPFHYQIIRKYGENSIVWDGPTPTLVITKPELIKEILNKVYDLEKPDQNPLQKELSNGLIRLEGRKWARSRKLNNPAFHMEKLKNMLPAFSESYNEMIKEWEKKLHTTESRKVEVEMWSYLHNLSADAISRAAFGSSFQEGRRVSELLREHIAITVLAMQSVYIPGWRFLPTKTNKRATEIIKEIETVLQDMILKRQKAIANGELEKDDLLGILLKSSIGGKIKLSLKEVIEECKIFYIAGQEPVTSLLVWTLTLLSKHQDWQDQARDEILSTFGNRMPNFDDLNSLKKVNMILQEVLRLYPPVPSLSRQVSQNVTVGGKLLPSGVQLELLLLLVHHDEKIWGADAKEFNPGRFSKGISKATGGNISFFSFGWGPRICIGSNFAMMEVKMGLSLILQRFRLDLSPSYAHAPTRRGTVKPKFEANLVLRLL